MILGWHRGILTLSINGRTGQFCSIKWTQDLHSSGILCGVDWEFITEVSEQPVGPFFKGQAVPVVSARLTLENGTDKFSQNVGNEQHIYTV